LASRDAVLGKVISQVRLPRLQLDRDYFQVLVQTIINQQLSDKAGATIVRRFEALFGKSFPSPKQVLSMDARRIRGTGVSGAKTKYIKNLAKAVQRKKVNFALLKSLSDDQVIEALTEVKGIGKWTAEMFLIFTLGRPDVFSYGDVGLQNAIARLYRIRGPHLVRRIHALERKWKPQRSLACRFLWASLDKKIKI
jgi:DNA-3-methyladenine glycosylase II